MCRLQGAGLCLTGRKVEKAQGAERAQAEDGGGAQPVSRPQHSLLPHVFSILDKIMLVCPFYLMSVM